jgi:hypothetical protein
MSKKIKSPKELFEQKRQDLLDRLNSQKIMGEESLKNKEISRRVLSPRILFGDQDIVEEPIRKDVVVEEIQEEDFEEKFNLLLSDVDYLKECIDSDKKYGKEIKFLKRSIDNFKKEIDEEEKFDATYIYRNICDLKETIENIRNEIPEVPEPIRYDNDLNELRNVIIEVKKSIPEVPEVKYYDDQIDEILNSIESVRGQVENLPEVKYYDYQLTKIEEKIEEVNKSIPIVPEVRYYDDDITYLEDKVDSVKKSIPVVPEVRYYDSEIELIENQIETLKKNIDTLPEVKYYDSDIKSLLEKISHLKSSVSDLPEPKYYDDEIKSLDLKLKEIKESIPKPQIIPEVKYYDDEIRTLQSDVNDLFKKVSLIKITDGKQIEKLQEDYQKNNQILNQKIKNLEEIFEYFNKSQEEALKEELAEPPETNNSDPLTPLNQEFVTFKQLQDHYRTFINRIQQQISTIGGGGETQLKYLDDIVGISSNPEEYDGKYLKYNHTIRKFEFSTIVGESGDFSGTLTGLFDVDQSTLDDGDIIVYNAAQEKFIFVSPSSFGINTDANPDPNMDDYGHYN